MAFCRVLVVACLCFPFVDSLVGYDCSSKIANISAISIFSVAPCEEEPVAGHEKAEVIQLLQERTVTRIPVITCLVERSHVIYHCGMHSHASLGQIASGEVIHLSREQCQLLHSHGTYSLGIGVCDDRIIVNGTKQHSVTEHGFIDGSFNCEGTSFSYRGMNYHKAVMVASYTIKLTEERATLSMDDGQLRLSSGYAHSFKTGSSFDISSGDVFWKLDGPEHCSPTSYIVLYEGPAYVYVSPTQERTLVVNSSTQALAVGLTKGVTVCNQYATRTEHPRLLVVSKSVGQPLFYFQRSSLDPQDVDMFMYVNSKLVYVEKHLGRELSSVYKHFHMQLCETNRQMLRQLTTLAIIAPEEFAWLYSGKPGVTALTRGELVYLMECEMVVVGLRKPSKCYQELPVTYNGTDVFLKPRSRILVNFGTEVECSPLVPSGYLIDGKWWALRQSQAYELPTPITISAETTTPKWQYTSPAQLFRIGIYTMDELLEYQKRILFSFEKPAIVHTLSAAAAHQPADLSGLDGSALFQPGQLDRIQKNFMAKMWGWYWDISVALGGAVGLYMVFQLLRTVLGLYSTATWLYKTYGCSVEMLACCCSTLSKFLVLERRVNPEWTPFRERLRRFVISAADVSVRDTDDQAQESTTLSPPIDVQPMSFSQLPQMQSLYPRTE
ncbi:G [Lonestar tick chuvirus 1]|uniref:G n=1 Tax=Lonestar tick chuvirus 1 TaxID=1844927 RepID=A0A172MHP4_9VIRU|nr:G [Lonestar tick chuvirus 1] [Lonestar tick chuvirus 1]ANC97698.1 G [Lonestar tick chuvirus 1] [Lonestar tick chuvirus 1]